MWVGLTLSFDGLNEQKEWPPWTRENSPEECLPTSSTPPALLRIEPAGLAHITDFALISFHNFISQSFIINICTLYWFCFLEKPIQFGQSHKTSLGKFLNELFSFPRVCSSLLHWSRNPYKVENGITDSGSSDGKELTCNVGDLGSIPGLGRSPRGRHGKLPQYSCLENPHGQRSLAVYSPRGCKESDVTEWRSTHMKQK